MNYNQDHSDIVIHFNIERKSHNKSIDVKSSKKKVDLIFRNHRRAGGNQNQFPEK